MPKFLRLLIFTLLVVVIGATPAYGKEVTIREDIKLDITVHSGNPGSKYWGRHYLSLGYDSRGGNLKSRLYLQYDLEKIIAQQISPEQIVSAKLNFMQYNYMGNLPTYEAQIFVPKTTWEFKQLMWSNQPQYNIIGESQIQSKDSGWKTYDVTEIFKSQLTDGNWENGLGIRFKNEDLRGVHYWSSECILVTDTITCGMYETPYIEIVYDDMSLLPATLLSPQHNQITNQSQIEFSWSNTSIADNLNYKLEISKDSQFSNIIFAQDGLIETRSLIDLPSEGKFYWRITSQSNEENKISETLTFEIDKTSPFKPEISELVEQTETRHVDLYFSHDEETIEYEIQLSHDASFSDTTNNKTFENSYRYSELQIGRYYFRVRAWDKAGNSSEWSKVVSTELIEAEIKPILIEIDNLYISPLGSAGTLDSAVIKVTKESTDTNVNLFILDSNLNVMDSIPFETETITLPNSEVELIEGHYTLYTENSQNNRSNSINLVVDNSAPKEPMAVINNYSDVTNLKTLIMEFQTEAGTINQIYLNDNLINFFNSDHSTLEVELTVEGENIVKINSTDKAGNSSTSNISILTDWTPPTTPKLTLSGDTVSKSIKAKVITDEDAIIEIYNAAGLHLDEIKTGVEITLITPWKQQVRYPFYAIAYDKAGNVSSKSRVESYTTPAEASVLGVSTSKTAIPNISVEASKCKIKYNSDFKLITEQDCNISKPVIYKTEHIRPEGDIFWINVYGFHNNSIELEIQYVKCQKNSIFKPSTWNKCIEESIRTEHHKLKGDGQILTRIGDRKFNEYSKNLSNNSHYHLLTASGENHSGKELYNQAEFIFSHKVDKDVWFDFRTTTHPSNKLLLLQAQVVRNDGNGNKYFRYPFEKLIGVTQWHGNTVFSKHTGIDFGSGIEPIYAMADGYIKYAKWDDYNGECLSGGYYIQIEHDNGMHSLYLHLNDFQRADGSTTQPGQRVLKGERIGTSGNSGAYSCQPLGYHLHAEIWKENKQSSNVNPVDWIDIDWSKIPTLGADIYPGRLSGNNPHPGY